MAVIVRPIYTTKMFKEALSSVTSRFNSHETRPSSGSSAPTNSVNEKGVTVREGNVAVAAGEDPEADRMLQPGGLSFDDDTQGGMGRHLGLFSTTFLMYDHFSKPPFAETGAE